MPDPALLAPRLVAFACDALRYADGLGERTARRLIVAPYSGVARTDARALIVAAGERLSVREAIERGLVPLDAVARENALGFVRALGDLERTYRAQGAMLGDFIAALRAAFDARTAGDETLAATFAELTRAAREFDERAGAGWTVEAALEALAPVAALAAGAAHGSPQLTVLPARAPEPSSAVRRRRGHFSASSLGTYAECERRWYYRYVCAAVEDKGSSASFYGSAFHWALEQFHERFKRGDAAPREVLAEELDRWIQTAFDRFSGRFDGPLEALLQTRRARRTARRYLDWFLERSRAQPFTVVGTETEANLVLDGYDFIGYIDRLDRDDATGAIAVIDYKTGSIAESAPEYRDRVREFLDFQLPFYYWATTAQGERVSRLALVPLKDALREVQPVELEVVPVAVPVAATAWRSPTGTIGIDELERARAKMIELARRLADEPVEHFAVTRDPSVCTYCAYNVACTGRPPRTPERFAR